MKKKLVFGLAGGAIAALFALELYLQASAIVTLVPPERPDFDVRTPLGVARDLEREGFRVVPALFPSNILREHKAGEIFPLCGISTSTTVFCNETGDYVFYPSDAHGHNNPPGLPDRADVVVIGDSFAHGQCVPQGDDIAGRLRARGLSAVNLGCAGSGPMTELAALVEYGIPLRPKTIVWLYYEGNDLADLLDEQRNATLPRYLEDGFTQHLSDRQPEIDAFWTRWLDARKSSAVDRYTRPPIDFGEVVRLAKLRGLLGLRAVDRVDPETALRPIFARAKALADRAGAKILFVYGPSWGRRHDLIFHDRRPELAALIASLGIDFLDFAAAVEADPDPDRFYPFRRIGHLDADGFELLASLIAAQLIPGNTPRQ